VHQVFVMQVRPGREYYELIGGDAMLPANSFVPPDEASLDVPGSPRADGLATSYLLPAELGSNSCPVRFTGLPRTESRVVRVGPTTPTRAARLADASVDHTEARNAPVFVAD
jgi:hypothetical protein